MLTWLLTTRGTSRLIGFYFGVAFLAMVTVLATCVVVAARHDTASSTTLQLHITQFRG
jgi:hypothetical protein